MGVAAAQNGCSPPLRLRPLGMTGAVDQWVAFGEGLRHMVGGMTAEARKPGSRKQRQATPRERARSAMSLFRRAAQEYGSSLNPELFARRLEVIFTDNDKQKLRMRRLIGEQSGEINEADFEWYDSQLDKSEKADIKWFLELLKKSMYETESKNPGYTGYLPPSQPADTSQPGMGDDLNTEVKKARTEVVRRGRDDFDTEVKKAKAENLARAGASAALQLATYEALVKNVDLFNPELPPDERLTRARRLLGAYDRLRRANPDFKDSNAQLTEARRIQKAAHREHHKATREDGSAVRRGRPRKAALG